MANVTITKQKVFAGFIWRFLERCGAQGVTLVVSVLLARMLSPGDYGTVALITIITNILGVFVDSGFGSALVQKKNTDDVDYSSVFYFNIVVCSVLYAFMYVFAPVIASFYNMGNLTPMVRVISFTLVISGVKNVQQAYVRKNMLFKKFFFSTLGGTIGAAVIGITMAYMGFGAWALVAQSLFNTTIDTLILWMTVKFRPKATFSLKRMKVLFSYGWKLLVSNLLETIYTNFTQMVIGKRYSSADLAFYNKGFMFPSQIVSSVNSSIDSVLFPVLSDYQDDRERMRNIVRRGIKVSVYIMAPMMIGMAFTAVPIVRILLSEKWLPCVPYLQIFCICFLFYPIHTANLNAISAIGRSDLYLRLEIIKKIIGIIIIFITMRFGVFAMAGGVLVGSFISQLINSSPNRKLLNYKYLDQMKDILPGILLASGMGAIVWALRLLLLQSNLTDFWILVVQIIVGAAVYIFGSCVFHLEAFEYIMELIKPKLDGLYHNVLTAKREVKKK